MEGQQFTLELPLAEQSGARSRAAVVATRALDIVVALLALVLLLPVLALIALVVRLDSRGPALFRQRRLGEGMRPFTVVKFRTMTADADPEPHRAYVRSLLAGNGDEEGEGLYKLVVDPRVTKVGRVLRKLSLDELPQLWNVLRGQMSLVGPRPVIPYEVEHYPPSYGERFGAKPGMTGLWQVSGRNERSYAEMVELDIQYVRRRSLGLDLSILARTVWVVLTRQGVA